MAWILRCAQACQDDPRWPAHVELTGDDTSRSDWQERAHRRGDAAQALRRSWIRVGEHQQSLEMAFQVASTSRRCRRGTAIQSNTPVPPTRYEAAHGLRPPGGDRSGGVSGTVITTDLRFPASFLPPVAHRAEPRESTPPRGGESTPSSAAEPRPSGGRQRPGRDATGPFDTV